MTIFSVVVESTGVVSDSSSRGKETNFDLMCKVLLKVIHRIKNGERMGKRTPRERGGRNRKSRKKTGISKRKRRKRKGGRQKRLVRVVFHRVEKQTKLANVF